MSQAITVDGESIKNHGWRVTFAGMGINLALGVLYTWSVFKKNIPEDFQQGRCFQEPGFHVPFPHQGAHMLEDLLEELTALFHVGNIGTKHRMLTVSLEHGHDLFKEPLHGLPF